MRRENSDRFPPLHFDGDSSPLATYTDWTALTASAQRNLASIIIDALARGVNPKEIAWVISKRLDVSMSRALLTMALTEQVGALRLAQRNETKWARERLGLNTGMLWISALLPTTRWWHAERHGKIYTTEQVEAFYAVNGNRYNRYCSQIPVILDERGEIVNQGLLEKLDKERSAWKKL